MIRPKPILSGLLRAPRQGIFRPNLQGVYPPNIQRIDSEAVRAIFAKRKRRRELWRKAWVWLRGFLAASVAGGIVLLIIWAAYSWRF